VLIIDKSAHIEYANPKVYEVTQYSKQELENANANIFKSPEINKGAVTEFWDHVNNGHEWQGEMQLRKKNGEVMWVLMSVSPIFDDAHEITHFVSVFEDVSQLKEAHLRMEELAYVDSLTGLANRMLFRDRLEQALKALMRTGSSAALLYLDLDEFKPVNDTFGHEAGDKVLIEVSQRLKGLIREQDTASRLGGDEFALLLGDLHSITQCEQMMVRIHQALAQPYLINGKPIIIAASSGVTIYPTDNATPDTLIRHADLAMYQAKLAGRNRYHLFDSSNDLVVIKQHETRNEIELAFSKSEFCLYYQPKVNMLTGKAYGAEALIRWNHPEKGLVPPLDFLPSIEATPLEIKVGNWVIEQALKQLDNWRVEGINLTVSVNISSLHLQWQGFYQQVEQALARYPQILSDQLQLEILESSILSDVNMISEIIKNCRKKLGISIALDDFGTGYSSLTHLRRIPADTIKIDQSFIRDMLVDESDYAIVEGIIMLANTFGRDVIAEGVETKEHGLKLISLGCIHAQGYGIARPMPANNLLPWLKKYRPFAEWIEHAKMI